MSSQVLETAIGLVLLLFMLASAASAVYELGLRLLNRRAKDLEKALRAMLGDPPGASKKSWRTAIKVLLGRLGRLLRRRGQEQPGASNGQEQPGASRSWTEFTDTSVYRGLVAARQVKPTKREAPPAYLSAKAFADAISELDLTGHTLSGPVAARVGALEAEVGDDWLRIKAGLERWFDEAMTGVSSQYRKWSSVILFGIGVVLAITLNASVIHVAHELWADAATRQVVVAAATATSQSTAPPDLGSVGHTAAELSAAGLPIGWISDSGPKWGAGSWGTHIAGWILTGLLVSLGAPFWFDLLGRLVAVRSPRPPKASEDETSAVSLVTKEGRGAPGTALPWPTRRSDQAALGSASKQGNAL